MKSDDEMIREMEQIEAEDGFEEHFERVPDRASKNLTAVYGLRFTPDEFREFDALAKAAGKKSLAEYIRSLLRAARDGDLDYEKAEALGAVREKARELAAAVEKL